MFYHLFSLPFIFLALLPVCFEELCPIFEIDNMMVHAWKLSRSGNKSFNQGLDANKTMLLFICSPRDPRILSCLNQSCDKGEECHMSFFHSSL